MMKALIRTILEMSSLKPHTQRTKSTRLSKRRNGRGLGILLVSLMGISCSTNVIAQVTTPSCVDIGPDSYELGTGVDWSGYCNQMYLGAVIQQLAAITTNTGDSSKTENLSLLKQADELAQQIIAAQQLTIQTETLIKDLEENPLQVIVPDANQIIANQKQIDQLAQDIANNSNQIGDNLIKDLKMPSTIGLGQGSKFQLWSQARRKAVEESYDLVTGFIEDASADNKTIWQAIKNLNAAQGKTQTAKSAGQIAAQQLTMLQKMARTLNELLGAQATENGAKLQQDMDQAAARTQVINEGLGPRIIIPSDSYNGPGDPNSMPF